MKISNADYSVDIHLLKDEDRVWIECGSDWDPHGFAMISKEDARKLGEELLRLSVEAV